MDPDGPDMREVVAALVRQEEPSRPGPPVLAVPEGAAEEVITVARRLALRALPTERWRTEPAPGLQELAAALVVDEHPSAPGWSPAERERLAAWVAVLIEHRGEEGVQELVRVLNEA
ncbi:hypothetical protein P3T27_004329 [Kitasatospora sp. MAA19]|uniref:hypothetical protein n=1 Tax=unclassified Kitasatospora TaxID=2633591 RepID=UPI002474A540|nr:hypothetical protein [Kitasatospora sp. MAA19]MDH6707592.1 hypothetical protein [Kitasatospora sp. MAA19]